MTNTRCLTEGVDVPAIDCVVFADPKQSRIDIVQAAGRALRTHEGKKYGYILLPLVVPRETDFEEFAETTAFRQVVRTIAALSIQDERIVDEFRAILQGRRPTGKIVEIGGYVPVGMHMSLGRFAWRDYCNSGRRPSEIPFFGRLRKRLAGFEPSWAHERHREQCRMCDEQEQQGRPNQLFFRGNHLDWPSQPNRRPPGTPIWPNLARVIDLQEFMGRRSSHPQARRCGPLPVPRSAALSCAPT
jgi:superfamily II DNA or RNA helicase